MQGLVNFLRYPPNNMGTQKPLPTDKFGIDHILERCNSNVSHFLVFLLLLREMDPSKGTYTSFRIIHEEKSTFDLDKNPLPVYIVCDVAGLATNSIFSVFFL